MKSNNKILLVSLMLLISQMGFCLLNIWYSQNVYIQRKQQQSYTQYLYSTDAYLEDLKHRLEEIKLINKTVYENIVQLALKHNAKEVLLSLSGKEEIQFMSEKEQEMMLKIIMSRLMTHFHKADINLNGKPKTNSASAKPSQTMNKIKKAGNEKPETRILSRAKANDTKPGNSNLPEKRKVRTPSVKIETSSPVKVIVTKQGNKNPPEKLNVGRPSVKAGTLSVTVRTSKQGTNNPPEKSKVGTPVPAQVKDTKKKLLPSTLGMESSKLDQSLFKGREEINYEECSMTLLERRFSEDTLRGGRWFPRNCKPQQRIAIIVPYRDRDKHLKLLLNNLIPKLRRQKMDYTFYVVEQASAGTRFNRGMIRNIGFLEAKKEAKYDCYIFNDVDTIIENDLNIYTCKPNAAYHIAVKVAKYKYRHLYPKLIGGILSFTADFFIKTNGYSNFFFVWGGEDDAMYERVMAVKGKIIRPDYNVSHTTTAMHDRDPMFKERYSLLKVNSRFWKKDGLNSLEYHKLVTEKRKLYTWIYVNINETKYSEMMNSYNAEWKRLHPTISTPLPKAENQTTKNISKTLLREKGYTVNNVTYYT